ncbi:hypothetical protein Barb7_02742 [Bacteroidales bacterium Barb7]|nr:hypothetical protein Barb7_02742 [Bacteroidales bacterium Barb7]
MYRTFDGNLFCQRRCVPVPEAFQRMGKRIETGGCRKCRRKVFNILRDQHGNISLHQRMPQRIFPSAMRSINAYFGHFRACACRSRNKDEFYIPLFDFTGRFGTQIVIQVSPIAQNRCDSFSRIQRTASANTDNNID